ncbi:MAG: hypothetical protein QG657_603 [Acidobacteriota bacterium]|nr:hypothetical protein [Acidobacteriota bacterium]
MADKPNTLPETSSNNMCSKESAEIDLLKAQRKSLKFSNILEIVKSILIGAGAVAVFLILHHPESYIKIKSSTEEIQRERAKMFLELLKEKDAQKILMGIKALKHVYPIGEEDWLVKIEKDYIGQTDAPIIEKALRDYTAAMEKGKALENQLSRLKKMLPKKEPSPGIPPPPTVSVDPEPPIDGGRLSIKPENIPGKIRELETEIILNNYTIRSNKLILETHGVPLELDESQEIDDWKGKWYTSWEVDNQISYQKEALNNPLTFEIKGDTLIGSYTFKINDTPVNGEIRDIKVNQNCLTGNYYERGSKETGTGTVEFLMFPGKKDAFIGRYKHLKSNFTKIDGYYKIWIGKRIEK